MAVRTVAVRLALEVGKYVSGAQQAIKVTKDFRGELAQAAAKGDLDAVASRATAAGLALTGAFAGIAGAAANFDKAMSSVDAATMTSAANLEQLRQAALQAGADTAFSASEAAAGIEELAKAGVGTADILGGGLRGALDLAAAGQIEVGEAAETAASAMVQFGLSGQDVTHVADLLAAGAGKAQGGVLDMAMALKQTGLVAAQTGLSIEETTGTLAAFASAGLLGSDAGTSFKTMLLRLAAPTGEAAELMQQLGISAFDAQGNFVGMAKFAGTLQNALRGMSQQQRQATLETIFGTDAIRSAGIVYEQGRDGIQEWIDAVDDQGFASEQAAKKLDNLMGDVEELTGSLETLAIESGSGANEGLRILTQAATALVNQFGDLPPVISGTAVVLAGVSGVALLAFAAFIKMKGSAALALAELRAMGPAGTRAAGGLQVAGRWAGRATAAFIGLQIASLALDAVLRNDLNPQIDALGVGLDRWAKKGQVSGEVARVLGNDMEKLRDALGAMGDEGFWADVGNTIAGAVEGMLPFLKNVDDSMAKTKERIEAVDSALAQMQQAGHGEAAAATFAEIAEMAEAEGISIERLKELFPQYSSALEVAAEQGGTTAGSIEEVGGAASQTAEEVEELLDAFDRLFGIQMDLDEALIAYKQGLVDLAEELDDGAASLSLNSQAGRDNRSAVLDQIDAIADLRQANIDNGMSIEDANAKYQDQLDVIAQMLIDRGFEEQAVRDLIESYRDIPNRVSTTVSTPGLDAANAAAQRLYERIERLRDRTINITLNWTQQGAGAIPAGYGASIYERWGGVVAAQRGMLIPAHITSSPTVMYGERATGMEAYVPMRGNVARSTRILSEAASWYGMRLARASYGTPYSGAGTGVPAPPAAAEVDQRGLARVVAREVAHCIDGARLVIDDRGNGRLVAQQAGYYARGG